MSTSPAAFAPRALRPLNLRSSAGLIGASAVLGIVSYLIWPTELLNDANAWLIWARGLTHGGVLTVGGATTSWKPLPVFVSVLPAWAGPKAAAVSWMLITRTAAAATSLLLFRLASRRGGWAGGAVAAVLPWLMQDWVLYSFGGGCEVLAAALLLGSIEAWLAGADRWVLALLTLICLVRPDAILLLAAWCLWMLYRERGRAAAPVSIAAAVLLASWPLSMAVLMGDPLQIVHRAGDWRDSGMPSYWIGQLADEATGDLTLFIGVLVLLAIGAWHALRERDRPLLAAASVGAGGLVSEVLLWALDSPQESRYLLPGLVALCAVAGAGAGIAVSSVRPFALRVLAAAAVAAAVALPAAGQWEWTSSHVARWTYFHGQVDAAVAVVKAAGGPSALRRCLPATAPRNLVRGLSYPLIAQRLGMNPGEFKYSPAAPTIAVTTTRVVPSLGLRPTVIGVTSSTTLASKGPWTVVYLAGNRPCEAERKAG